MSGVVVSWSGGKDSAMALHALREADVEIEALLTTVSSATDRTLSHGVRRSVQERQVESLGLPLDVVTLPPEPSNEAYERVMNRAMRRHRERGVERIVYADLFLEDVRAYREERLDDTGLEGWWPLWGRDTTALAREFLDAGFRAIVVAADTEPFDSDAVGRAFDDDFLTDLPAGVDPCGERGAFHTFVHDGPGFDGPVPIEVGETVTRSVGDGEFHYADLRLRR